MRLRLVFLCTVAGITLSRSAFAARNVEVIQHPSLFMLGDVSQLVGVNYGFSDHSGTGSSGRSHALSERYTLSTTAAILDPDIVTIQLDAGLIYQQTFSTGTSSYLDAQYNMMLTGMATSPYPFSVTSTRDTSLIASGYTPAYTLTSTNNQVTASLMHSVLPMQFSYAHGTSESSGLVQDYSSSNDSSSLNVSNTIEGVAVSHALLSYTSSDVSNGRVSRSYIVNVDNSTNLDKERNYVLNSRAQLQELKPIDVPQRTLSLSEALSCRFGAVLLGSASYDFSDSSTTDFNGRSQSLQSNTFTASLSHRLYASLSTNVSGSYNSSGGFGGNSSTYGGTVGVNYFKLLPAESSLSASASYSRKVTDQNMLLSEVTVRDEEHRAPEQERIIKVNTTGTLSRIISVRSLNPDITYEEGRDYRENLAAGGIEILTDNVDNRIAPGTVLYISYATRVNPRISYQSDTYNTGFVLTLFSGHWSLGADYSTLDETLLAGEASSAPLNHSRNYGMRSEVRYGTANLGVDYSSSESTSQKFSRAGAHASYSKMISRTDSFAMNLRDDYFMYPAVGGSSSYDENAITAGASYSTRLFDFVRVAMSVGASDSRSRFGSGDTVSLRITTNADYRRVSLSLSAMTLYRFTNRSTNRDTNVNFSITRSF